MADSEGSLSLPTLVTQARPGPLARATGSRKETGSVSQLGSEFSFLAKIQIYYKIHANHDQLFCLWGQTGQQDLPRSVTKGWWGVAARLQWRSGAEMSLNFKTNILACLALLWDLTACPAPASAGMVAL